MASACVNNNIGMSPENFEFRLQPPVTMLPADQLFSDGKLIPLHLKTSPPSSSSSSAAVTTTGTISDPSIFSPKAPRCSSRWKELLGLRKLYHSTNGTSSTTTTNKTTSFNTTTTTTKSLKNFLHRKTTSDNNNGSSSSSLSLPLLKDTDCESLSISSRLSLSSSSSSHDHDDLPRRSLDSEKPNQNPNLNNLNQISIRRNPRVRLVKPRAGSFDKTEPVYNNRVGRSPIRSEQSGTGGCRGVSVDSPRMNSSGKIVFQSLERSSSSPGSFNGGPRFKHRGMERSYSANVRVTPVLNVPVCSLRGGSKSGSVFGLLFSSPQKKEGNGKSHQQQQHSVRNRN